MTSPLVKPVSGYSTLSRLLRDRVRPSTLTGTLSGLIGHTFPDDLRRRLVGAQPAPSRMPQPTLARPLGERDLTDEVGLDPLRIARVLAGHGRRKGRGVAPTRGEVVLEVA